MLQTESELYLLLKCFKSYELTAVLYNFITDILKKQSKYNLVIFDSGIITY